MSQPINKGDYLLRQAGKALRRLQAYYQVENEKKAKKARRKQRA